MAAGSRIKHSQHFLRIDWVNFADDDASTVGPITDSLMTFQGETIFSTIKKINASFD